MKRIVICADGTWNVRDHLDKTTGTRRPTNVTKVARAVLPRADLDQVVFYHEGVGTGRGLDRFTGGAFGDGIESNIRELYRSIAYNYVDGDELFFFGFSRGAFTVRALVGFMNAVGILQKGDDYWVPELYGCYENGNGPGSPQLTAVLAKVEHPVLPCPDIKFVGVWDTVGALGAPGLLGQVFGRNKYAHLDVNLNPHVQNAYQALAIDERRKPFRPSVWTRPPGWSGTIEQAWFPGFHSDVGGGQPRDGLPNQALHWIVEKAEKHGLHFDNDFLRHSRPCLNGDMHDSMSTMYRLMGPIDRDLSSGEAVLAHRCAADRLDDAGSQYRNPALRALIDSGGGRVYETSRVPTRTAC